MSSSPGVVQPCPADRQLSSPVQGVYDPGLLDIGRDADLPQDGLDQRTADLLVAAEELLRVALIAKLSVDLADPRPRAHRSTASQHRVSPHSSSSTAGGHGRTARLLLDLPGAERHGADATQDPLEGQRALVRVREAVRLRAALPTDDWAADTEEQEPPSDWTEAIGQ